uniref:Serine protease inhibitor n=1 Tax=Amblyomma americanum TaxID=6943 RepID=A0A0E9Y380_AMBAM
MIAAEPSVVSVVAMEKRPSASMIVMIVWLAAAPAAFVSAPEDVSRATNELGMALYRKVAETDPKGSNIFMSPVSVAAILGMVQLGSRGRTRQQINAALEGGAGSNRLARGSNAADSDDIAAGFGELFKDLNSEKGYELRLASAVFLATGLPIFERYKRDLEKHFASGVYSANFAGNAREAADDVNSWVRDMTEDRIPEIIERPLPPSAPMLVLNAVYFKGLWQTPFKPEDTITGEFFNEGGSRPVPVQMMRQKGEFVYALSESLDAHILEMPYVGDRVDLVIVLPRRRDGLRELEEKFSLEAAREPLAAALPRKVDVWLPKFQLQQAYSLKGPLQALGVRDVFSTRDANLTGVSSKRPLALDEVLHKALLDVDEKGTEAVALSSGIIRHSKTPGGEVEFKADHPFLFFIEDVRTQTLLFLGRLQRV